jgi:hypothetical protein
MDSADFWAKVGGLVAALGVFPSAVGVAETSPHWSRLLTNPWFDAGAACEVLAFVALIRVFFLRLAHLHAEAHRCPDPAAHLLPFQQPPLRPFPLVKPDLVPFVQPLDDGPAMPPQEKTFTDRTPENLTGFFSEGLTDMQVQKLLHPFIGKWMTVAGPVDYVGAKGQVTFADRGVWSERKAVHMFFEGPEWLDRLSMLSPGTHITVIGRIHAVEKTGTTLYDCELVDDAAQGP